METKRVLVTGATGYIGGRLLRSLEAKKYRLRAMARRPEYLSGKTEKSTEVVSGDVFDPVSLRSALKGVHTAYYLIHSLARKGSFVENDRRAASTFAEAAVAEKVEKIIYFGGLGRGGGLSKHLASRQEVGEILRNSGVPTIEFRASIVIGSGSLSYEMARALVEKLPVMTTPRWVRTLAQPIAIEDVIKYLVSALNYNPERSVVFEIGGADRVSYEGIMRAYVKIRGMRRLIIPLPVLSPGLSSLWLALVTPLYYRVGHSLIEGVRNETVVTDDTAERLFKVRPRGVEESIMRALVNEDREIAETHWSDALPSNSLEHHWGGVKFGSRFVDSRELEVSAPPSFAFKPIQSIGGHTGWYSYDWLWNFRGLIDKLIGGVGKRRDRIKPHDLRPGDIIDFWRVEAVVPGRMLRLAAEMKLPGRAWLQFETEENNGGAIIRQTSIFDPVGVSGRIYWYLLYPLHSLIFNGMLKSIDKSLADY